MSKGSPSKQLWLWPEVGEITLMGRELSKRAKKGSPLRVYSLTWKPTCGPSGKFPSRNTVGTKQRSELSLYETIDSPSQFKQGCLRRLEMQFSHLSPSGYW